MKSIDRLSGSRVSPSGTRKHTQRSIQGRAGEIAICLQKMKQAQTKLPSTAPTEKKARNVFIRRVAAVMSTSGRKGGERAGRGEKAVNSEGEKGVTQNGTN